jgi:serpin B
MPYGSGDFRMSIIVPNMGYGWATDSSVSIDDIIAELTPEKWEKWTSGNTPYKFYLGLPRFKFKYEVELNEMLKTLGMQIAFDRSLADFSDMFLDGEGWIDKAKQKTFIQVDEKGTEAAAITQIIFVDSAHPPIICNRPFLIVIYEDVSGTILFMGRIANPVWED